MSLTWYIRSKNHISLFFVDEKHHRQGIGRKLFEIMQRDYDTKEFTVNSSPYAVKAYEHLGFECVDTEQTVNGIRCIPMRYNG
ncbi:MAG: GNAT family N-acetyltransferase [Clostridia bacterium]|nr:GNAT family N-acetyltransferase [Clostridia bacterium]